MTIPHAPRSPFSSSRRPRSMATWPDGASERSSASRGGRDQSRPDHARDGRSRPGDGRGKGPLPDCHTIGQSGGALRFPDLAGVAGRAGERVPGMSVLDYLAQSLYEPDAFVVPGFDPGMPTINRPPIGLTNRESSPCSLPPVPGRYADGHAADEPPVLPPRLHRGRRRPTPPRAHRSQPLPDRAPRPPHPPRQTRPPGLVSSCLLQGTRPWSGARCTSCSSRCRAGPRGPRERRGSSMNILILVAVVAAFGLLRFRRASLLLWAVAWWAGIYILLRFGFTVPIPPRSSQSTWESCRSRSWRTCLRARNDETRFPALWSGS